MHPRFLLDTHIVVRWLAAPEKLSREQTRVLRHALLIVSTAHVEKLRLITSDQRIIASNLVPVIV